MRYAALTIVLLLSSCYMRTPKQESWSNPDFKNHSLGKTLVLCNAESESRCRQFEALFVQHLLPYVPAGPFHASEDEIGKIEREELEAILKENSIKTLVVTSLVDGSEKAQTVVTGYDAAPYDSSYWGYYDWGYMLTANTATISSYMEFLLETRIYDVASKKLIWTGRKSIYDDRSDSQNMNLIIQNVVSDLRNQGMLQ